MSGKVYLIPTTLGDVSPTAVLPKAIKTVIHSLDYFIVEREKTARHFIKTICPDKAQSELNFYLIDKHTPETAYRNYLKVCDKGIDVGIISEAGLPAIADPGAKIVALAHQKQLTVKPLTGPSSIFLALMSSGLNGQNFAFNGYLPIDEQDKKRRLKQLERRSFEEHQSQIFIETPFRNQKLYDSFLRYLSDETKLCIAIDLTLDSESIQTKSIRQWKKEKPNLHKRPAIFIIELI